MKTRRLFVIILCVLLLESVFPASLLAADDMETGTVSAVSADDDEPDMSMQQTEDESGEPQPAENILQPVEDIAQPTEDSMGEADVYGSSSDVPDAVISVDGERITDTAVTSEDGTGSNPSAVSDGSGDLPVQPIIDPSGQNGTEIIEVTEPVTEGASVEEAEKEEEKEKEEEPDQGEAFPAFSQSRTVNGVIVTVSAETGVFPEDAVLSVAAVSSSQVESLIEEEQDADQNIAVSYTFDIKVLDANGNEIQPAEGQSVNVSFRTEEIADVNLDTQVYHISDNGSVEELDVDTSGETAIVETDGFSEYSLVFIYNSLRYVMQGDSTVPLSDILAAVGLSGEVTAAQSSDTNCFTVSQDASNEWSVTSLRNNFSGKLMVTINSADFDIIIVAGSQSSYKHSNGFINNIPSVRDGYVYINGIKWQVIGRNDTQYLLISADVLGGTMNWENAMSYGNTVYEGFSAAEKAAVKYTQKDDRQYSSYFFTFRAGRVAADLFLLSGEEADTYFSGNGDRAAGGGWWWLRSLYSLYDNHAGVVDGDGRVSRNDVIDDDNAGARPAFQLNRESVLFESAAEGGKSSADAGGGEFGNLKTSSERKLTLIDKNITGFSASASSTTVSPGGSLAVSYSGASTGTGKYVSAVLCDSSGAILYYASLTPESSGSGTWNMTIPADLAEGNYTFKVFSEQQNGDKMTDYASTPSEISLKVAGSYSVTVNNGTTENSPATTGDTVTIKANDPKDGEFFKSWTSEDGVVFADSSKSTTTFTMPAKNVTVTANYGKILIEDINAQVYTGKQIEPEISKVELEGVDAILVLGKDYELSYGENVHTGEKAGSVTVTLKGDFTGTVNKTFDITQAPLTVTADSAHQVYNGKALTAGYFYEGLLGSDTITSAKVNGSQTDVGESENTVTNGSVVIKNDAGEDCTDDYTISYAPGTLKVTPYIGKVTVTVKGHAAASAYDGSEHEASGYDASADVSLYQVSDINFKGNASVKAADAGVTPMGLSSGDFSNGSSNFTNVVFEVEDGSLTIEPAKATITVDSASKVQGEADPAFTGKVEGLVKDGDLGKIEYARKGKDEEPGTYKGVLIAKYTKNVNYDVTVTNGDFTITDKPVEKATLTFDLAGGTLDGETGKITVEANVGDTIKLPSAPTREGYTFQYWKGSEYKAGAEYEVEGDHTFTAIWEENKAKTYTVTFNANGHGTAPATQTVEEGKKASKPTDPTASGYTFGGWYTDKECRSAYSFDTAVTKDITLYAKWTVNSSNAGGTNGTAATGSTVTGAKTGDSSHVGAWAGLLAAAAACLVLALMVKRRSGRG